jgi:hypothetical protein
MDLRCAMMCGARAAIVQILGHAWKLLKGRLGLWPCATAQTSAARGCSSPLLNGKRLPVRSRTLSSIGNDTYRANAHGWLLGVARSYFLAVSSQRLHPAPPTRRSGDDSLSDAGSLIRYFTPDGSSVLLERDRCRAAGGAWRPRSARLMARPVCAPPATPGSVGQGRTCGARGPA